MNTNNNDKIVRLQNLEQNLNSIISQRQQYQVQNLEVENALSQLDNSNKVFRIIGNIMVGSTKSQVKTELVEKKEFLTLRIDAFNKQELKLREEASELHNIIMRNKDTNVRETG